MRDVLPAIAGSDHVLRWYLALSVERQIAGAGSDEELRRADITQPMLSALTRVLRDNGATPTGFVGDRIGKIAAALAAGALLLNDAALIVSIRSWHQERTCRADEWPQALGADAAAALLQEPDDALKIAAINSIRFVTIAGPAAENWQAGR